jgi:hypothetical protein
MLLILLHVMCDFMFKLVHGDQLLDETRRKRGTAVIDEASASLGRMKMPDLGIFGISGLRAFSREYPQIPIASDPADKPARRKADASMPGSVLNPCWPVDQTLDAGKRLE